MFTVLVELDVGIVRIRLPDAVDDEAVLVSAGRNVDDGVMHSELGVVPQWACGSGPMVEIACYDDIALGVARLNEANAVFGRLDTKSRGVGNG